VTAVPDLDTGQPTYDPTSHRYFYNNHGQQTPATHSEYVHAITPQNRLFLAAAILFTTLAVAITWQERNRRSRPPMSRTLPLS
jgi:hypothetical protein